MVRIQTYVDSHGARCAVTPAKMAQDWGPPEAVPCAMLTSFYGAARAPTRDVSAARRRSPHLPCGHLLPGGEKGRRNRLLTCAAQADLRRDGGGLRDSPVDELQLDGAAAAEFVDDRADGAVDRAFD